MCSSDLIEHCVRRIQGKLLAPGQLFGKQSGVVGGHMDRLSALDAGHVQCPLAGRSRHILIQSLPTTRLGAATGFSLRLQLGQIPIDCAETDLPLPQVPGDFSRRQQLMGVGA